MSSKSLKSREPEPRDKNGKEWRCYYVRHEILGGVGTEMLITAIKNGKSFDVLKMFIDDIVDDFKPKKGRTK